MAFWVRKERYDVVSQEATRRRRASRVYERRQKRLQPRDFGRVEEGATMAGGAL